MEFTFDITGKPVASAEGGDSPGLFTEGEVEEVLTRLEANPMVLGPAIAFDRGTLRVRLTVPAASATLAMNMALTAVQGAVSRDLHSVEVAFSHA